MAENNTVESTEEPPKPQPAQRFQHNRQQPPKRGGRWNNPNETPQQDPNKFNKNCPPQNREENYAESIDSQGNDSRRFHPRPYLNKLENAIRYLSETPTIELPSYDLSEKKFSAQNRLYIGNVPNDTTEEELKGLFEPFGEVTEIFINKEKCFGFVKMDYHAGAVKARNELDGTALKGKFLKVKTSPNVVAVKVLNLGPSVTGELLLHAFLPFGEIESAKVLVDEKGRSIGEGIIEFARKFSAVQAVQKCQEKCYFLGFSIRPVIVEPYECPDQSVGLLDKHINKRNQDFMKERSVGPRLAEPGSFEDEYGTRWKALYELNKQKMESLKVEFRLECEKLEAQMEYARYEHETETLRAQLKHRELDKERQKREWEMRERHVEEERRRSDLYIRQSQKEFHSKTWQNKCANVKLEQPSEDLLLKQAQSLNSILEAQEGLENVPSSSTRDMSTFESAYKEKQNGPNSPHQYAHQTWSRNNNENGNNRDGGTWVKYESQNYNNPKKRRFF